MKKAICTLTMVGLAVVGVATRATADERLTAHVPFPFIVGSQLLPAGHYIVEEPDATPEVLRIESPDGKVWALTLTTAASTPRELKHDVELTFVKFEREYFLSGVDMPAGNREIPLSPRQMQQELRQAENSTRK